MDNTKDTGGRMQKAEFAAIVQKYQKQLLVIAFHICQNRHDAEDVVQDTFLKLYAKQPKVQSEDHLRNWLVRMAVKA